MRNGDANPSIWFSRKNRGVCQVCDSHAWSNIDLVMMTTETQYSLTRSAGLHKDSRFPLLRKGQASGRAAAVDSTVSVWDRRPIYGDTSCAAVCSRHSPGRRRKWSKRSERSPTAKVAPVISYLGIMRYTGIASAATVRAALLQLQKLHLLEIVRNVSNGFRACNAYQFTPDDPAFLAIAREYHDHHQGLIQAQRNERAARRFIPRSTLSSIVEVEGKFTLHPTEVSNFGRKAGLP
jgi:hypothetical protein